MELLSTQVQNLNNVNTSEMTPSMSDELSSMKNTSVSKNIAERVDKCLTEFQEVLNELLTSVNNYQFYYNEYKNTIFTDGALLKARIKEKVIRVMNDDI